MREAFRVASSHQPGDAATIIGAEGAALANAKTVLLDQRTNVAGSPTTPVAVKRRLYWPAMLPAFAPQTRRAKRPPLCDRRAAATARKYGWEPRFCWWCWPAVRAVFYIYKARKLAQQQVAAPTTQAPTQSAESNQTGTTATGPTQTELTKPADTKVDNQKSISVIARLRQSKPSTRRPKTTSPRKSTEPANSRVT